ncbi:aminotransferase class IV [Adhaeribacter rhizoryzae]|uniref:branched-chain-amino-acid transaminase n=1 Tax=Adhaeribacter rhizoryzae TaxID=2607907 RepID=A0A5M6DPX0_9BACT|nr:aminotransferase class IV [Adhaeribacter rhizoryzae]KAA5548230.1 amino acid aminotransferase [Adhaeribacter rhizoryzae]
MPTNNQLPVNKDLFAFVNSQIVPVSEAYLHISDLAIQRGYGIFDFFKVNNEHAYFLDDYLKRFDNSAAQMQLNIPLAPEALKTVIRELIAKNNLVESGIKMILTGGYSADGYQPGTPNLIITQQPFSLPTQAQYNTGIKIITHEYVRELPTAKTINYTIGIRLIQRIKDSLAEDVLYHQEGIVSEFPRCNFFIVKQDNTVVTPLNNVLLGITRKNVLHLAKEKYKAVEGPVTLTDIFAAKEAFLTSTTKRILPIVQIDDKNIGTGKPGAVTLNLLADLIALEEKDWVGKQVAE